MAHVLSEETSLTRKRDSLKSETGALGIALKLEIALAAVLLVAGGVVYAVKGSDTLFWVGVAVAALGLGHYLKVKDNRTEEKRTEAGIRGESKVSSMLADTLDNTHYIFNDVLVRVGRKTAQLDHLIVSPAGLFILETKNWRGRIEGGEYDERWKQFKAPGQDPVLVSNPVHQCARHKAIVTSALQRAGIKDIGVQPMVVFMPRTDIAVTWQDTPVLHPADAIQFLQAYVPERNYAEEEVTGALNYFMKVIGR